MSDIIVQLRNGKVIYPRPKWYGSVRVLRDGRMRFGPWAFDEANHVTIQYGSPHSSHGVYISGHQALLLYPWLGKISQITAPWMLPEGYGPDRESQERDGLAAGRRRRT